MGFFDIYQERKVLQNDQFWILKKVITILNFFFTLLQELFKIAQHEWNVQTEKHKCE